MSDAPPPPSPIALLLRRWYVVVLGGVIGAAAGFAYASFAPKWYSATLTVVQSNRSSEAGIASLANKLPAGLDSVSPDVQRIQAILVSNSVLDEVIDKFKLLERYDVEFREQARGELSTHCSTTMDRRAGVVSLTCEDKDPQVAKDIAAYFGEVGNRVFRRVNGSSATEERKFLEAQVEKARKEVDDVAVQLRQFQEQHKIVDLPEQSKAVISAMASIQADLLSKQLELSYLSGFSSRTEANVVQLQRQIALLEAKKRELERENGLPSTTDKAGSGSGDFFPGAMSMPKLRYELQALMRSQAIAEARFSLLTQRYEIAKVDEARDTSTFQILDSPTLPSYKTRPRRKRAVGLGLLAGLALMAGFVVIPSQVRRLLSLR